MDNPVKDLDTRLEACTDDRQRVRLLNELSRALLKQFDYGRSKEVAHQALQLAEDIGDLRAQGTALRLLGSNHREEGEYAEALAYYSRSLPILRSVGDMRGIVACVNNMAIVHERLASYKKALELHFEALGIWEEMEDEEGVAHAYTNIGLWHRNQDQCDAALEYSLKALEIYEEIENENRVAYVLNNIGYLQMKRDNYEDALQYLQRSLKLKEQLDMRSVMSTTLINLAECHQWKGDTPAALQCCERALEFAKSTGNKREMVDVLVVLAHICQDSTEYNKALAYLDEAQEMAKQTGTKEQELTICDLMSGTYEALGDHPKALEFCKRRADMEHALFNAMHVSIDDAVTKLVESTVARERIESELKVAHDIQMGMLPSLVPPLTDRSEFDIYAVLEPAKEVGGDLFDVFFIDNDHLCFVVGDVSGKGVPAALFMAVTQTLIKAAARETGSPEEILDRVNKETSHDNTSCMFVTMFCGILNIRSGEVCYANGGHNPPLVIRLGEQVEFLNLETGRAVGLVEDTVFTRETLTLHPGDGIYLYTDGVTEARGKDGDMFSEERLLTNVRAHQHDTCRELVEMTLREVKAFSHGMSQTDDITVLVLNYRQSAGSQHCSVSYGA